MGCIPSKSSLDVQPKSKPKSEMTSVARGSSVEHPRSISSMETKVAPEKVAPIPPRVDCIAPRPKPSEESLRRRKAEAEHTHHEGGTTAVAGAGAGAAVQGESGAATTGGGDAGGGGDGGGGDGGGGE